MEFKFNVGDLVVNKNGLTGRVVARAPAGDTGIVKNFEFDENMYKVAMFDKGGNTMPIRDLAGGKKKSKKRWMAESRLT